MISWQVNLCLIQFTFSVCSCVHLQGESPARADMSEYKPEPAPFYLTLVDGTRRKLQCPVCGHDESPPRARLSRREGMDFSM